MIEAALACASECGARPCRRERPHFHATGRSFDRRQADQSTSATPTSFQSGTTEENIDAALALAVNNRPEMHLADDVLPEDVVRAVAVEVTGTHELPGRYDWGEDVDASALALAVQHRPIVHLAVAVLPEHVSGSDPGVVDGRSKGGIAEAGSALVPPAAVHPALVWMPIVTLPPSTMTGLPELAIWVSASYRSVPEGRATSVLAERSAMGLLCLVLRCAGEDRRSSVPAHPRRSR